MIKIVKYSKLNGLTKSKLDAYINDEFGHIPIVTETEWSKPDWTIIKYQNDTIVTFYNIVEREISVDDGTFKVGGINNVITPRQYRGKGYASQVLKETENVIFNQLKCDMGVLLCADSLLPFYERLNWYRVECPIFFRQSSGVKLWKANAMLLTKKEKMNPQKIDLNGLPW